jgi:MoaA/NifB/PqqE/SkfB family radical SAM enzyme
MAGGRDTMRKSLLATSLLNVRYAFRPHKPLLTLRLARTLFAVHVLGRRPLRYVDTAIHYRCNLRCGHCFATVLASPGRAVLAAEDYRRLAREAMAEGAVNFSFQGGEPTIDLDQLLAVIACFSPGRNLISVTTNATLLDEEKVLRLRRAGVDILTISLDSGIAAEHDAFRGRAGAFDRVMAVLDAAARHGLRVTLGATVHKGNLHGEGLARLRELAAARRLILFLSLAAPAGNWQGNEAGLLDAADLATIREWERSSTYLRTDFHANWKDVGCGAVKEILYVTPYGDVFPCPFIHLSLGNVREESVGAIRRRARALPLFGAYHPQCLCGEDQAFMTGEMRRIGAAAAAGKLLTARELFAGEGTR